LVRIDDIKVIVYDKNDTENRITSSFLALGGRKFLSYGDENEAGAVIDSLKAGGFRSKEVVILKKFMGRVYQKCPGSKNMICCNYHLLNTCFDCFYNCSYCFLNSYLNSYGIVQFTNLDGMMDEIIGNIDLEKDFVYRIGTGEFTDSLMMDQVTGIAERIIEDAAEYKNIMIEFKTKSNNIDHLLDIGHKGNAVLAWSLNTERNIEQYEEGTASLDDRIEAALRAEEAGYYLAFHFDPIIPYLGFMEDYSRVIDRLFHKIDPERIVWISMGCFRHTPGFKEIIMDKFPEERLTSEEMFPGLDGKMRYIKHKRVDIYKKFKNMINSYSGAPFIYLCMEPSDVWKSVFDVDYSTNEDLENAFSEYLKANHIK